jgi:hydroxymethylbilane synthase
MIKKIRIGTRGSKLALWQANHVKRQIAVYFSSVKGVINIIHTQGDRDQTSSLTQIGGQGIFTRAIEQALIDNKVDMAIHSLKDLPSSMSDELCLGAVLVRGKVNDVFIGREVHDFFELPTGATVASGSIRRRSQLGYLRPDIQFCDLRGNIETRLKKLEQSRFDGIIMAEVALERLDIKNVEFHRFSLDEVLPAVGQGAIGIQVRCGDDYLLPVLKRLNDFNSYHCVSAERAFLNRLDSGCQFPVAAYAEITNDSVNLRGLVASKDGQTVLKDSIIGSCSEAKKIGTLLAEKMIEKGAIKLLQEE